MLILTKCCSKCVASRMKKLSGMQQKVQKWRVGNLPHAVGVCCEQSTSAIEGNICERHDAGYYQDKREGVIHPEDVRVFCVFTYRAMPVNTNIFHFLQFDASEREHKATGRVLKFLHQAVTSQDTGTSQCGDCMESCEKGMLYFYHHFADEHKLEFPFLCKVDLTAIGLGHEWLVYGQMPPYYWAFPLNSDKAGLLQPHF